MKKKQVCRMSLPSVLVLLLVLLPIRSSTIGSAGLHPASSARSFASSLDDCTPPVGVTIQAPYASSYTACALGSFGLEGPTGGISFREGYYYDFLVANFAETSDAVIYGVPVDRGPHDHVIGFHGGESGPDAPFASVGMAYGPENVLFYSRRPNNELGEVKEWSYQTDRVIALSPLGVSQAVSGINFVPGGFPHAGELKLVTKENSDWYEAILSPEADGTYSIATITQTTTISPHPGSFVYVPPASPEFFDYQALLVAEDNNAAISAYSLDSESNPVPASRTPFLTGLSDITGLAIDPWTGDLIVATRGGTAIAVRGFGTMPPAAPSIIGWVTIGGSYDHIVPNVRIDAGDKTVFTDAWGRYRIYGLAAGDYTVTASKSGYSMQPSEIPVTVPPQGQIRADFTARPVSSYPPVVLVHGYLGLSGPRDKCEYGVDHYDKPGGYGILFENLPQWLVADGFDVWVAHWDSGQWPETNPTFEYNGGCLARDIAMVKQLTGASQVILLAHSMGGHVSRAYLQSDTYAARNDVQTLILFGSAQGGISALHLAVFGFVGALAVFCIPQPGFCQMSSMYMAFFNARNESNTVNYHLIGGDGMVGPLNRALFVTEGLNDGLAGLASATGKYQLVGVTLNAVNHPLTRYKTHEAHIDDWGSWYFEPRPGQTWSDSYKCAREILLGLERADCTVAPEPPARVQAQGSPYALAPMQRGHISTGETINRTLPIDATGRSTFTLTWVTQTLSLNLVNPNGVTIDPAYALANPAIVALDSGSAGNGLPGWMTYAFTNTVPGDWTLGISAPDAGPDGTDWGAIATFESGRTLEVGADAAVYGIGDTATLTAKLMSETSGIAGATVRVDLARSDDVTDTLTLTDMGGGLYRGTYVMPNAPGYLEATFTANGSDGGTVFARQYSQLLSIMPQTGQLTGSYADRAVDENGNGGDDALEVDVGIDISTTGDYNLSADLRVGDQIVAQSSKVFSAIAGVQTVTLRFDGDDIYDAGLDGPYLLTNLMLVDLQVAVPTIMQSNLYTTAAYEYAQFEPNPTAVELRGLAAGRGPGGLAAAAVALCALAVALGLRRLRARAS